MYRPFPLLTGQSQRGLLLSRKCLDKYHKIGTHLPPQNPIKIFDHRLSEN